MIVYIDYIKKLANVNFVGWDVKTITAGDYTVFFKITKDFYKQFKAKFGSEKPLD